MNKILLVAGVTLLWSCASHEKAHSLGMANPASVHCEKIGGKLDIVRGIEGEEGFCTLPSGERIEEWSLYRRDNRR